MQLHQLDREQVEDNVRNEEGEEDPSCFVSWCDVTIAHSRDGHYRPVEGREVV